MINYRPDCILARDNLVNCVLDAGYRSMRERASIAVEYE